MLSAYVKAELNLRQLHVQTADRNDTKLECTPDARMLGKRLGAKYKAVAAAIKTLPSLVVRQVRVLALPGQNLLWCSPVVCFLLSPGVSSCFLWVRACCTCVIVHQRFIAPVRSRVSHVYGYVLTSGAGQLRDQGQMSVAGEVVQADEVYIARKFVGSQGSLEAVAVEDMDGALLLMDIEVDEEALMLSAARDLVNRVQKLKKKAGVSPSDSLVLAYQVVLMIRASSSQVACGHASLSAFLSPQPALAISVDGGESSL